MPEYIFIWVRVSDFSCGKNKCQKVRLDHDCLVAYAGFFSVKHKSGVKEDRFSSIVLH